MSRPHTCFFCGHEITADPTKPLPRILANPTANPSAFSDGLSDLSYVAPHDRNWYWLLLRMKGYTIPAIAKRWAVTEHKVLTALRSLLVNDRYRALATARRRFQQQRQGARKRGIEWQFDFDSWWDLWRKSGHYGSRGTRTGGYVMARTGDSGPYAPGNVRICSAEENVREAVARLSEECVREIRTSRGRHAVLAERFGLSYNAIRDIRKRRSYRWVI